MRHVYQDQTIGGADILNSLADVNINNPEDGQMMVYDASTQTWRNVTQKSLNDLAEVTDLTNIIATGTTNATGSTIPKGTFFYLNDDLCQAKADIASGATFTLNTNYEEVTAGGLNALYSKIAQTDKVSVTVGSGATYKSVLDSLFALVDHSKITINTKLVRWYTSNMFVPFIIREYEYGTYMQFSNAMVHSNGARIMVYYLKSNSSTAFVATGSTRIEDTNSSVSAGEVWEIRY